MLTTEQLGKRFGVSPVTARQWILRGLLPGQKFGRDWMVAEQDAQAFTPPSPKGGRPKRKEN